MTENNEILNAKFNVFKRIAGETFNEIKAGFKPDSGTTGFKVFISSIKNLWFSSVAGEILIAAIFFWCAVLFVFTYNISHTGASGDYEYIEVFRASMPESRYDPGMIMESLNTAWGN